MEEDIPLSRRMTRKPAAAKDAAGMKKPAAMDAGGKKPNLLLLSEIVHDKNRRKDIRVAIKRYHLTRLPESQQLVAFRGLLKAMLGINFAKGQYFNPLRLLKKNCPGAAGRSMKWSPHTRLSMRKKRV